MKLLTLAIMQEMADRTNIPAHRFMWKTAQQLQPGFDVRRRGSMHRCRVITKLSWTSSSTVTVLTSMLNWASFQSPLIFSIIWKNPRGRRRWKEQELSRGLVYIKGGEVFGGVCDCQKWQVWYTSSSASNYFLKTQQSGSVSAHVDCEWCAIKPAMFMLVNTILNFQ